MKWYPDRKPNGWDAALALAVLALAAVCAFFLWRGGSAREVVVSFDGAEVERVRVEELGEGKTYSHNGYTLTLVADEGGVRVRESDCPNRDCVHTGTISREGQSIVCLPARITIRLVGGAADGVDAAVG